LALARLHHAFNAPSSQLELFLTQKRVVGHSVIFDAGRGAQAAYRWNRPRRVLVRHHDCGVGQSGK
jgi:hypothetical protein